MDLTGVRVLIRVGGNFMTLAFLADLAHNDTYFWELLILVVILLIILCFLFLGGDEGEETVPAAAKLADDTDREPSLAKATTATPEPEPAKEPEPAMSEVAALTGVRTDEALGVVYDSAPEQVDDLTKISGVGKVLAGKLNDFGVYRYEQIAGWSGEVIAAFSERLSFKGRVEREEWVRQAKELAKTGD